MHNYTLSSLADATCWIKEVTIIALSEVQALFIALHPAAALGDHIILPLDYFPFLQQALSRDEAACWCLTDGTGIESIISWPELKEERSVGQLHNAHVEYQLCTMYSRPSATA